MWNISIFLHRFRAGHFISTGYVTMEMHLCLFYVFFHCFSSFLFQKELVFALHIKLCRCMCCVFVFEIVNKWIYPIKNICFFLSWNLLLVMANFFSLEIYHSSDNDNNFVIFFSRKWVWLQLRNVFFLCRFKWWKCHTQSNEWWYFYCCFFVADAWPWHSPSVAAHRVKFLYFYEL